MIFVFFYTIFFAPKILLVYTNSFAPKILFFLRQNSYLFYTKFFIKKMFFEKTYWCKKKKKNGVKKEKNWCKKWRKKLV